MPVVHLDLPAAPSRNVPRVPARAAGPLELGFLTPHDVGNPAAFSGTPHFAARALRRNPKIRLRVLTDPPRHALNRLLRRPSDTADISPADFNGLDAVVGLVATCLAPRVPAGLPFLHVTDATPSFLHETYGWELPEGAFAAERRTAQRASRVIYSSAAMAARAAADLGLPGLRPDILPFGVNFTDPPSERPLKPPLSAPRLLFVGRDWTRKGGDIAIGALAHLHERGIAATLDIVGPCPDSVKGIDGVRAHGFVDRRRWWGAQKLAGLYRRAHLLVLPTRGDCTPMVIAEAMAHAMPVVVTDIGGVSEVIGGEGAGLTLPSTAGASDWAAAIAGLMARPMAWEMMSDAAFDRARSRMSWDVWAAEIADFAHTDRMLHKMRHESRRHTGEAAKAG